MLLFVSFFIIFIPCLSNKGHKIEGHIYRRMSNQVRSLIRTPRKAFEKKVRFLFVG